MGYHTQLPTMTDLLHVFFGERLVGDIRPLSDGWMSFEYSDEWLEGTGGFPISTSLPLESGNESGLPPHAFFANLLPESSLKEAVANVLGVETSDDYALLEAMGGECAGALTILPEGDSPEAHVGSYERLAPETIAQMARSFDVFAEVTERWGPRLSLAGAQDKLPVRIDESGEVWLPLSGAPSTHILKVPSRGFEHLPANETLLTALARAQSLDVVDIELVRFEDVEVAVVRRYDRLVGDDGETITRLHQEDLCQALGLPAWEKYEKDEGPGFANAVELIRAQSTKPLGDVQQLLKWIVFILLAGNADGHGKNLSFLRGLDGLSPCLAPFYDFVCTRVYQHLDRSLAMGIGGERDPEVVGRQHWESMAVIVGMGSGTVFREVERQATSMLTVFDEVADEHVAKYGMSPMVQSIRKVIREQGLRTLELLRE